MECYFCRKNIQAIDHKSLNTLRSFISASGKIKTAKKTGLCASHQRDLSKAIKRSRNLGLLSTTAKYANN
ncbi:MAG TPA: 30S ribosomal protein S18 [Candidatus Pacearchaeota archaeon]|nr:30S ribosomal protein S18 [Candidatus Pacearchaeota archaeon]